MNRNEHALAIARAATEIYSKTSGGLGHGEILNILDRELGWQTLRSPSTEEARSTAEQMFTLELQAENARLKKDRDEWRALWGIGGSAAIGTLKKRAEHLEADNAKLRSDIENLKNSHKAAMQLVTEENAKLREEKDKLEKEVRESLWYHGHDHLYGDDGEMQCSQCREWDYKRGDLNVLREQAFKARMENVAKAFNWKDRAETAERQLSEAQEALRKIDVLLQRMSLACTLPQDDFQRATRKVADEAHGIAAAAIGKEGQLGATEEGDKGK